MLYLLIHHGRIEQGNRIGKAGAFLLLLLACQPPSSAAARVIVFDAATGVGHPAVIRLQTRGRVFSAGGVLAEVSVDERGVGRVLTGADGFGYLTYAPARPGLLPVEARSGVDSGRGLLLAAGPQEPVVVVEIDGPVRRLPKLTEAVAGAAKSLRALTDVYRIVYLAGMLGPAVDRAWLDSVGMPESVVLPGNGSAVMKSLREKGLLLFAAVGSKSLLLAAGEIVPHRFGFEGAAGAVRIKSWEELEKRLLRIGSPPPSP